MFFLGKNLKTSEEKIWSEYFPLCAKIAHSGVGFMLSCGQR